MKFLTIETLTFHPYNIKRPSEPFLAGNKGRVPFFLFQPVCPAAPFPDPPRTAPEKEEGTICQEKEIPATEEEAHSEAAMNLEAVLFLAREPLSSRRLAQLADLPEGTKVRSLLRELNLRYDRRQSAFHVIEVAGGFQLRTRPEFAPWLARLQEVPVTIRLSMPVMETLAVIAYKQPVLRAEVEQIRGVQCGELIRQLLDRDLVRIVGRSEELGRPFFYGTTKNFLQVFGLGSLEELPDRSLLSRSGVENSDETG